MPLSSTYAALACRTLPLAVALLPALAAAQVYKCVDRGGHTTYQQSPCTGGQSGAPIELADPVLARPGAPSSEKSEAVWQAAAREGRAVVGMPKPFVTQGMGTPADIRAPRSGEVGGEVWVYPKGTEVIRIGFQDNAVVWIRSDAKAAERPSGAPGAPAVVVDRETRVREALTVGKPCAAALQDAGPPDREEPLIVGQGAGSGSRHVYVFNAANANANAYAAFVCLQGRVTSVERYQPERPAPTPGAAPR